jgi:hypothetical protein
MHVTLKARAVHIRAWRPIYLALPRDRMTISSDVTPDNAGLSIEHAVYVHPNLSRQCACQVRRRFRSSITNLD